MEKFIHRDFMLETEDASLLYHEYAKDLPVIDYHNHLSPADISGDVKFANLTKAWLAGDHYKWRAMRTLGIDEKYITGNAPDRKKFDKWSETVPCCLRNPLYHWTHLELARYFGIDDKLLCPDTSEEIYNACNEMLGFDSFSTVNLLNRMNVEALCTTDDPVDNLKHHIAWKERGLTPLLFPAWRPDMAMKIENAKTFNDWVDKLERSSDKSISSFNEFIDAIMDRHDFFHAQGCRVSDHGIDTFYPPDIPEREIVKIFSDTRSGKAPNQEAASKFKGYMLYRLSLLNHAKGWVQQYHFGVLRNNNSRMFSRLGPDSGYDGIGDYRHAQNLVRLLDRLDSENSLSKTILYPINPSDNEMAATIIGSFQEGPVKGKLQLGSGWWFLDQKKGMEDQMNSLSLMGMLSTFIGMTTDSRSFLSFPRHEYFRRILCNLFGNDIAKGLIPRDYKHAGRIIQDICYYNAREYFGLN